MDEQRVAFVRKLGEEHARVETAGDLEATMKTLVAEPVYEFHPAGRVLRGQAGVRRYYEHLIGHFLPHVESAVVIDEWCSESSLAQEYDVHVRIDGVLERHRVLGILAVGDELMTGERIYGSDRALRLMLGDLYDELPPLREG